MSKCEFEAAITIHTDTRNEMWYPCVIGAGTPNKRGGELKKAIANASDGDTLVLGSGNFTPSTVVGGSPSSGNNRLLPLRPGVKVRGVGPGFTTICLPSNDPPPNKPQGEYESCEEYESRCKNNWRRFPEFCRAGFVLSHGCILSEITVAMCRDLDNAIADGGGCPVWINSPKREDAGPCVVVLSNVEFLTDDAPITIQGEGPCRLELRNCINRSGKPIVIECESVEHEIVIHGCIGLESSEAALAIT